MKTLIIFWVSGWIMAGFSSGKELDMKDAISEIRRAPDWSRMTESELPAGGPKILDVLGKFSGIPPEVARKLVSGLMSSGDEFDLNASSKVYIFNRLYCNVPDSADQKAWKFFGGWGGVPYKDGVVNALYPLSLTKERKLELRYSFGGYTGPAYRGVEEFDFLFKRYGKRKPAE